jgi:site-specific DNA-cytosine methylase
MVQAGIRPVIAVEFDPSKPDLSRAIPSAHFVNAKTHHHNFSKYGCRIIQLTVQEVAQSGFLGFPRRPDYLHASPVCANFSQAHTAKAGKGGETTDDLTAAIAVAEAKPKYKPGHLPCNTILRCLRRAAPTHFTDHKGCNRSRFADIWLPDGTVKSLSVEGAAILQGFPGWYEFPNETATAGSIIGYSVPPSFASQLFMSAQSYSYVGNS